MADIISFASERDRRGLDPFRVHDPDTDLIGAVIANLAEADQDEAAPVMAQIFAMLDDTEAEDEARIALARYLERDAP